MAEERLPPQNVEAEQSVLGSILIDRDAIVRVAGFLRAEDFYREAHRSIYQAASTCSSAGSPPTSCSCATSWSGGGAWSWSGGRRTSRR